MPFPNPRIARFWASWISVCALILSAPLNVLAKDGQTNSQDSNDSNIRQPVRVVAHLNLPAPPVREMLLQERNAHQYLYVMPRSGDSFTVVDVTKPDKPEAVGKIDLPPGASDSNLETLGSRFVIAEESTAPRTVASSKPPSRETMQLLDVSDPKHPRVLQSFSGVTSVLADEGRRLVFIATANDGLWILKGRSRATTHPCTSEDEISGMPECY
jgi:hypothetical protein